LRADAKRAAFRRTVPVLSAAAAILLAAVIGVFLVTRPEPADFADSLAEELAAVRDGGASIERTGSSEVLAAHFAERGAPAAVYDLQAMGWRLVGGRVFHVRGTPASLAAYESQGRGKLVCGMLPGVLASLPKDGEAVVRDGVELRVFRRRGITIVVWQEKSVLCALASDIPRDEILALAVRKATPA
jgi:anti-sigma factor RsiW